MMSKVMVFGSDTKNVSSVSVLSCSWHFGNYEMPYLLASY